MKAHALILAIAVVAAGCGRPESGVDAVRRDDFEGRLIEIADQATPASRVTLTLFRYSSGNRPERYMITTECFDAGYFDAKRGSYVSGSAPELPHTGSLPIPHDRFCDADDLSRQRLLREWMFGGANISVQSDDGRAVVETPTGETAVFAERQSLPD